MGFNDIWFLLIGVIILSVVTDYLFSGNSFSTLAFFVRIDQLGSFSGLLHNVLVDYASNINRFTKKVPSPER